MKTMIKSILLAALFCCAFLTSNAQEEAPQRYYAFGYMKVKPDMHEEYLKVEKAWKKIHQANIKAGKYAFWELRRVLYPNGADAEYHYVVRTNFNGKEQLANYIENWSMPDNLESILTKEELELVNRTNETRTMVKEEIWSRTDQVVAEDMSDANIAIFNYFDYPEGATRADHVRVETELWKPAHKARVDAGLMKGWVLLQIELPYGSAYPYHAATVDVYSNMEQFLADVPDGFFDKIFPDISPEELMAETRKASDLIRSEVRIRVDNTAN